MTVGADRRASLPPERTTVPAEEFTAVHQRLRQITAESQALRKCIFEREGELLFEFLQRRGGPVSREEIVARFEHFPAVEGRVHGSATRYRASLFR